jgi:two-component system sensor histidine kinase DesK
MSVVDAVADGLTARSWGGPRICGGALCLVVAVHAAFIVPGSVLLGLELRQGISWPPNWAGALITSPLGLGLLALQLRLSLAFAGGARARGALWLLLAEAILVYLPMRWLGFSSLFWMQACLLAAAPMVLPRWPAAVVVTAPIVGSSLFGLVVDRYAVGAGPPMVTATSYVFVMTLSLVLPAAGLYGSAWLVRVIDELRETRAELAAVAVGRERLRIARDLHDLLGQSLAAVSLNGDLAIRLLGSDPAAAREKIESLTGLARDALRGIRAVGRDEHAVSLRHETEGAAALLAAAGVQARLDLDLPELPPALERLLAWAVREGVTNALRHSEARTCSISGRRLDGTIALEVLNDGVSGPVGEGSGLAGLAERARTLAGSVSAGRTAGGGFRLRVEVPERAT